ncbi:hypothetical protein BMS3Bbin07_00925 [bacterium BMS3Bbin07]|nr:hypothetical protein BMS3Bbin07_00925 [bacterium BMS3Bbin07]
MMDILSESRVALVAGLFLFTYLLNLPFGSLRVRARKFSFKWFMYIHIPIPAIFLLRVFSHLDFRYIPIFVFAAFMGQFHGGKIEV